MRKLLWLILALCVLTACGTPAAPPVAASEPESEGEWSFDDTLLVGRVVPLTGVLRSFGEGTPYVEQSALDAVNARGGVVLDGKRCRLELLCADSESSVRRAGEAAQELIAAGVDVMIVSNTADTVIPVSAACERAGLLCVSVDAPASAWLMGGPYQNSWHTFFDNEREMLCFEDVWKKIENNGRIGLMTANDSEGVEITTFIRDFAGQRGYTLVDPGRYSIGSESYAGFAKLFSAQKCDIILGVMNPRDFALFWRECAAAEYRPKLCTVAKGCLFAPDVEALGELGEGLVTELWWSPAFPGVSSVNGMNGAELAADYLAHVPAASQVVPPTLGYKHANVEILCDILKRAGTRKLPALNAAAAETELDTVVGHVAFHRNHVAYMPCAAGQWRRGAAGGYVQEVVGNYLMPRLELTAPVALLPEPETAEEGARK